MNKKRVAIIGATGYTGSELVRLLTLHEGVEVVGISSESRKGERFSDVHPAFLSINDQTLIGIEDIDGLQPDLVFLALPHGVSMDFVKAHRDQSYQIVDLSGDFRLSGKSVYEEWYRRPHHFEEGFNDAVFGLPELFRDDIKKSALIANPGCFPTSAILPIAPFVKEQLIDPMSIVIDAKTGVTGAGIKPKPATHFPAVNDNFTAYNLKHHRHTIEIQETLSKIASLDTMVLFTPHLLPVDRGILSTCYLKPKGGLTADQIQAVYESYYGNEPFIRIREELPNLKQVRGTNFCDVYATYDERTHTLIAIGVIDNLVKGAAGQAIQNMNLLLGFQESQGLIAPPIQP